MLSVRDTGSFGKTDLLLRPLSLPDAKTSLTEVPRMTTAWVVPTRSERILLAKVAKPKLRGSAILQDFGQGWQE